MSEKSKLWYLENINLFDGMSMEEMEKVEERTTMRSAEKGQYIYFPEEPSSSLYFLKEGRVKIGSYSDDGKENILAILKPGEVFGELALTGEGKRNEFAQALDPDVMICAMSMKDMEELMEMKPGLGVKITKLMGFRLKKMERRVNDLIFKDVRTRIIDLIREMAVEDGKPVGDEVLIKHNLTHQDMANLTGTSRQTVTQVLNELKDKGVIYMERKKILVHDMSKLN